MKEGVRRVHDTFEERGRRHVSTRMADDTNEQRLFDLAFELAYAIHVNKDVAFFIAEDALDALPLMLGRQQKNRVPMERLRGFIKWGERSRPLRKTVGLTDIQMLQWLVYLHSDTWERQTERGDGPYLPTEEDLIVRFIEFLVFLTVRKGSFYTTLAVLTILHQFDRRETRLFYDVLTQSDVARMKDTTYIGKQRLELVERVSQRFANMIRTVRKPGGEKQFVTRLITPEILDLINDTLKRFTPWQTSCVIRKGFDITDIPGLYLSDAAATKDNDETIEMTRMHTVLDPQCFTTLLDGLAKYVRGLPDQDQDRRCNYVTPDKRISLPQFSNFPNGPERGNRFQPPERSSEDYIRLERTLDARANRRKNFVPSELSVYVNSELLASFDPKTVRRSSIVVDHDIDFIEVRGQDSAGHLTPALLVLADDKSSENVNVTDIKPSNSMVEVFDEDAQGPLLATVIVSGDESFKDSIVLEAGQKITIQVQPIRNVRGDVKRASVEISYAETKLVRSISLYAKRLWHTVTDTIRNRQGINVIGRESWVRAVLALALIIAVLGLIWFTLRSRHTNEPPLLSGGLTPSPQVQPGATTIPSVTPTPIQKQTPTLIASATWNQSSEAAGEAIRLDNERGEITGVEILGRKRRVLIALPQLDFEKQAYSYYRITLVAGDRAIWQQTLRAPRVNLSRHAHVLNVLLPSANQISEGTLVLRFDAESKGDWRRLGEVALQRTVR